MQKLGGATRMTYLPELEGDSTAGQSIHIQSLQNPLQIHDGLMDMPAQAYTGRRPNSSPQKLPELCASGLRAQNHHRL